MISALILSALLAPSFAFVYAASVKLPARCTGTIYSLYDVAQAVQCPTVNIYGFTVPAGEPFELNLSDGATVNLYGDILFGNMSWTGPLFTISGNYITFNGNGYKFDGGGPYYWDGKGSAGGIQKPRPMMKIKISGTFSNTKVINSPAQSISVSNPGPLTITGIAVDNSQGNKPNSLSNGKAAAKNTDAFDCSTKDLTIENCSIRNQDDCLAINNGKNIVFRHNRCRGGHGISIGSVNSGASVSDIVISDNTVINNDQALRIKTDASASGSIVKNITYSGNIGKGLRRFGFILDQSYPTTLGSPGNGVAISEINFIGATNRISVGSEATAIAINCGEGTCPGSWDWSALQVSGGKTNFTHNSPSISYY